MVSPVPEVSISLEGPTWAIWSLLPETVAMPAFSTIMDVFDALMVMFPRKSSTELLKPESVTVPLLATITLLLPLNVYEPAAPNSRNWPEYEYVPGLGIIRFAAGLIH